MATPDRLRDTQVATRNIQEIIREASNPFGRFPHLTYVGRLENFDALNQTPHDYSMSFTTGEWRMTTTLTGSVAPRICSPDTHFIAEITMPFEIRHDWLAGLAWKVINDGGLRSDPRKSRTKLFFAVLQYNPITKISEGKVSLGTAQEFDLYIPQQTWSTIYLKDSTVIEALQASICHTPSEYMGRWLSFIDHVENMVPEQTLEMLKKTVSVLGVHQKHKR